MKLESRSVFIAEDGRRALEEMECPYCQGDLEGMQFGGSDGRNGGLVYCEGCKIRFAWIDNPFECEIQEGE